MSWSSVPKAVAEIRAGRPLVVTDAADRENEGDLIVAAEHATPDVVNFMVTHGRGLVCVPLLPDRLRALDLPQMVEDNTTLNATAFTVPVDARIGTTTGISAFERATTIAALIDPSTLPTDLLRPGHVFPLQADPGGVLERPGHTEAAIDLAVLAGCIPAGVVCEILDDDGTMARGEALESFAERHGLKKLAIADLVEYLGLAKTGRLTSDVAMAAETESDGSSGETRAISASGTSSSARSPERRVLERPAALALNGTSGADA